MTDFSSFDSSSYIPAAGYGSSSATPSPKKSPAAVPLPKNEGAGVISVNLRQFNACDRIEGDTNSVQLFGRMVKRVRVVGKVVSVESENTNTTYTLSDGTAETLVKDWNRAGFEAAEGQLIACVGEPRTAGGTAVISSIAVVQADELQLAHHRIEAVYTQCILEGPADPNEMSPQKLDAPAAISTPVKKPVGDVMELVKSELSEGKEEGHLIADVVARLSSFPEHRVRSAIQTLMKDGEANMGATEEHVSLV